MNESLSITDQTPIFSSLVYERLGTRITPEMGFQSYEKLDGDKEYRAIEAENFLADKIHNPTLDYPLIDAHELDLKAVSLEIIASQAEYLQDSMAASAVQSSAVYRMKEMAWLKEAKLLNELAQTQPDSNEYLASSERYQSLNEYLYGKLDQELVGQMYGEIFAQADAKQLDERGVRIYNELRYGTSFTVAGEEVIIPALGEKANGRLPEITTESLTTLGEVVREDTRFIDEITQSYWSDIIVSRAEQDKVDPGFTVEDMKSVFDQTLSLLDPQGEAGISIAIMPNKTALSWDTPTMTVEIGGKRAVITSPEDMAAKIKHELYVHGGRAINGLKSDLPVLGTGLYSEADLEAGERADYLTFEEGLATLVEMCSKGDKMTWTPLYLSRYLAAASTYDGADFRQAFEINWRARTLLAAKSGQSLTDAMIEKERKQAHLSTVRIRRGTPTQQSDGPVLTFNKDLAYLEGKLVAAKYLESVGDNLSAVRRLFTAKFDPTNHIQDELVTRYGIKPEA